MNIERLDGLFAYLNALTKLANSDVGYLCTKEIDECIGWIREELDGSASHGVTVELDGKKVAKSIYPEIPNTHNVNHQIANLPSYVLSTASTKQLSEELAKREGVSTYYVGPHGDHATIRFYNDKGEVSNIDVDGAWIIVNKD